MSDERSEDVLRFWFSQPDGDQATIAEEREYLVSGQLVHTRSMPPNLSQFLSDT